MATRSLNKVMLIGNIARDPELRYTPSGTAVCSFRIATNRSWMPSEGGERKEEAEFHRIVAWNKLAELCAQLITKGRKVYIEGRLQTRQWETQEGDKRYTTEIVAEDMVLLDSKRSNENGGDSGEEKREDASDVVQDEVPGKKKKNEGEKSDSEKDEGDKKKKSGTEDKGKKKSESKDEDEGDIDIDDIPF